MTRTQTEQTRTHRGQARPAGSVTKGRKRSRFLCSTRSAIAPVSRAAAATYEALRRMCPMVCAAIVIVIARTMHIWHFHAHMAQSLPDYGHARLAMSQHIYMGHKDIDVKADNTARRRAAKFWLGSVLLGWAACGHVLGLHHDASCAHSATHSRLRCLCIVQHGPMHASVRFCAASRHRARIASRAYLKLNCACPWPL